MIAYLSQTTQTECACVYGDPSAMRGATDGKVWTLGPFCAELCFWAVINRITVPNSRFALQVIVKHGQMPYYVMIDGKISCANRWDRKADHV